MQECFVYLTPDLLSKVIHMHYGYQHCRQSLRELTCINLIWTYENCIVADPSVLGAEHWFCVYLAWYGDGDKGEESLTSLGLSGQWAERGEVKPLVGTDVPHTAGGTLGTCLQHGYKVLIDNWGNSQYLPTTG